jgi:5'-3' exoribonuclease 1
MGVPGFFASLYTKYNKNNKFIFSKLDFLSENLEYYNINININSINELYIDTNCLIHPVCFNVYNENKLLLISNPSKLEDIMIKEVILYIEKIINYVNPNELVYIAIDGVAPMAKIKHQRLRRFKSVLDNQIKENIANKYNVEYIKPWNNSAITPGTEFMEKLTTAIINYLLLKKKNSENINKIKYIFSSANTPGEGEHKIHQYIKTSNLNKNRIIYGLDADLLYLSLVSNKYNLYLLREVTEFQKIKFQDEFCYVSIDIMKECIYKDMIENIDFIKPDTTYINNFIQDYIFLGFLLGNDFIPGLPSVNLQIPNKKLSGLEILINIYKEIFNEININNTNFEFLININPIKISYIFILKLFNKLSTLEESYFIEKTKYKKYVKSCQYDDAYNIELHKLEHLLFKIPDLFSFNNIIDFKDSKQKYNSHYFNNNMDTPIYQYIKSLYWNCFYYFNECPDYKFYYKYHRSPFVSDIYFWILNNENIINKIKNYYPLTYNYYKLITPIQQLFMVIPIQSAFLLPSSYKEIMINLPEYFPKNISQDFQLINKYWQAIPEIKILEPIYAYNKIKQIKLSNKEVNRNKFKKIYIIYI